MVTPQETEEEKTKRIVVYGIKLLVVFIAVLILNPFVLVPAGKRGIVLRFSAVNRVLSEGLQLRIPLIESVKKIPVRTVKMEVQADAASKDIQIVDSNIALNYHIQPDKVGDLFKEVGMGYEESIIHPAIQESVKATTAKYNAQELIEKREQVSQGIRELLSEKLSKWHMVVDAFSIVNFKFSPDFEKAVEAKQVAQQKALEEGNILEQVKRQAEQRVQKATAEATAIRIQAEAISKQGGRDYVALKWIERWNGSVPSITAGESGMILNVSDFLKK